MPDLDETFPFIVDGIHVLPVLHERMEYAGAARRAFELLDPDAVVVEIPSSLEDRWTQAIRRLPSISVLLYEDSLNRTLYLPVHPADPMVEVARCALERDRVLCCGDFDIDGYADYRDPAPDPYALSRLGLPPVYDAFRRQSRQRDPGDERREACLAFHARRLRAEGAQRVLLLSGMHHAEPLSRQLRTEQAEPLTPPARKGVRLVHLHPESIGEVLSEIPFYIAAYESWRNGAAETPEKASPDPVVKQRGPFRVLSGNRRQEAEQTRSAVVRAARDSVKGDPGRPMDRLRLQWSMLRSAERSLVQVAPDEEVHAWQRANLARFSRNLALASGQLVADLFDLVTAARGCVSENFGWELYHLAVAYPAQATTARDLGTARIRADEMFDGTRRIQLHRRIRRPKQPDWRKILRQRRRQERTPGDWIREFDSEAICSYPPEDVIIENFGRFLRNRGKRILSEERSRSVPFTTSVLDGIDVRETIRHWSEGQIYVRELGRAPGEVGSVMVVFDEDESLYPYCQTWLGEHDQESDMAFFSTDPAQAIIGPGICRVTYGGFILSGPPRRMADVWTDPDYAMAETRAEVLLLAGLDYCLEKVFVHVAPRPPRAVLARLAARLGVKILHLPLGTLSPATLRKLRVMHVLSGHEKRKIAKNYVW